MPALPRDELVARLESSFAESGYRFLLKGSTTEKPYRYIVYNDTERYSLIIYVWTLTQGGGSGRSRTDEYKIQLTLPNWQQRLLIEPDSITLLLGWSETLHIWAGFDVSRHQSLTGRSNMVSIYGDALEKAVHGQLGMSRKANGETAVALPPFFLVDYARRAVLLHRFAEDELSSEIIESATAANIETIAIADIAPTERSVQVREIAQRYRNRRFRSNVLAVYNNRCAMTGIQLHLVDAAHIIDVVHQESTDEIKNGLCLSVLCHRAFDAGLIGVLPDYRIVLNQAMIAALQSDTMAEGLDTLRGMLRPQILLPADAAQQPSAAYLQRRFELHGWDIASFA